MAREYALGWSAILGYAWNSGGGPLNLQQSALGSLGRRSDHAFNVHPWIPVATPRMHANLPHSTNKRSFKGGHQDGPKTGPTMATNTLGASLEPCGMISRPVSTVKATWTLGQRGQKGSHMSRKRPNVLRELHGPQPEHLVTISARKIHHEKHVRSTMFADSQGTRRLMI